MFKTFNKKHISVPLIYACVIKYTWSWISLHSLSAHKIYIAFKFNIIYLFKRYHRMNVWMSNIENDEDERGGILQLFIFAIYNIRKKFCRLYMRLSRVPNALLSAFNIRFNCIYTYSDHYQALSNKFKEKSLRYNKGQLLATI